MTPRIKAMYLSMPKAKLSRILHVLLYTFTAVAGLVASLNLSPLLIQLIGLTMAMVFGIFSVVGSITAVLGVFLSGKANFEWVELVGIILLLTAVTIYVVMLIYSGAIVVALWLAMALAISLVQRIVHIIRPHEYA